MKDSVRINMTSNINIATLIPASGSINTIERNMNKDESKRENLKQAEKLRDYFWTEKPIELEIIYSSIYGERWRMRGGFTRPKKIEE